jgi:hypothetical protein
VQPGVVAEAVGRGKIRLDPALGRRLDEVLDGKQRGIHLLARLQRIATVDEQHRAVHENDRGAGGAGKAGEPGQPLLAGGDIFVLLAIGARHDPAGQAAPRQLGPQRRHARSAGRALVAIFECLEAGFEHGRQSMGRTAARQCSRRVTPRAPYR